MEVIFAHFLTNITGYLLKPLLADQERHDSKYPVIFAGNQPVRRLDCTLVGDNYCDLGLIEFVPLILQFILYLLYSSTWLCLRIFCSMDGTLL